MSWQSGAEQLALEPGEKPRYVAYGFVWEDNPNGIQKCVLDLEDEIITIVEDWFTAPDGGNYSVHTLQLCDGVLTGIYYYDYSERNSYISYPVPSTSLFPGRTIWPAVRIGRTLNPGTGRRTRWIPRELPRGNPRGALGERVWPFFDTRCNLGYGVHKLYAKVFDFVMNRSYPVHLSSAS